MAQVNYNQSFGGRKMTAPPDSRRGKPFLLFGVAVLLVAGLAWLGYSEYSGKPEDKQAEKPAENKAQVKPVVAPVEKPLPVPAAKPLPEPPAEKPVAAPAKEAAAPEKTAVKAPDKVVPEPEAVEPTVAAAPATPAPVKPAVRKTAPLGGTAEFHKFLRESEEAYRNGEYVKARETADQAMAQVKFDSHEWLTAARALGRANLKLINTDCPFPGKKENHRIVAGDSLQKLAKLYNTTIEVIQRSNHMRPDDNNVMLDKVFRIYKGSWHITVSKKDYRLYLYDGDKLFKYYEIGIGKQGRTPLGKFHIIAKVAEPDWYSPHGKVPYRDKDNPIGTRWMKLQPDEGVDQDLNGYGIHGTWDRDSIGKSRSNGCIRMLNEDVEELFDLIPHQTPVVITE